MKRLGIREVSVLMMVAALTVASAQGVRFEQVQPDTFSSGGAFVNAWADFDLDGDADQFVGFDGMPNRLYRNDNGRFTDTAVAAGVADARPTRAVAWGDADADGDSDLLVGFTPAKPSEGRTPSLLKFYRNTSGVFRDDTDAAGLYVEQGAVRQPVWVDYDGDRDLDLFIASAIVRTRSTGTTTAASWMSVPAWALRTRAGPSGASGSIMTKTAIST
jgi:hypothetical protein